MEERDLNTNGELHHFQMVTPDGQIPLSISILVHVTPTGNNSSTPTSVSTNPISADEVITFHDQLRTFNGDFKAAFKSR
jgi:hypothetical protein